MSHVLAIDQGTTSSRAMVFRSDISIAASAQQEFPQHFPASGWVEHEPDDIWNSTIACCREAMKKANLTAKDIAAIGITNQRETTVVWDRATGKAVHRAIVWQDSRTAAGQTPVGGGPRPRQGGPPRHRLAGPPLRRHLHPPQIRGPRAHDFGQD